MMGGKLEMSLFVAPLSATVAQLPKTLHQRIKEVELVRFGGRPYYVLYFTDVESLVLAGDTLSDPPVSRFPTDTLIMQAQTTIPGARIREATLLDTYDAYYYAVGAVAPKRVPVLRVCFNDPASTWLYINPHNGSIFRRYDGYGRLMRWLVNGLHCLDFPFLIEHRPLWDIAVIGLSLGGLILSASAVIAGGRRLRHQWHFSALQPGVYKPPATTDKKGKDNVTV